MQAAGDGSAAAEPSTTPRAPRPWQPGDDIPDIHEADRFDPAPRVAEPAAASEVVDGDVVREVETPEVLDAQPAADQPPADESDEPKKGRGRGGRARAPREPKEPRAAKAPRVRKTAAPKPRAAKSRARKAAAE
jgi:hypothetical protein